MAKLKKGASANNHLRARLEYLHRAATYLQSASNPTEAPPTDTDVAKEPSPPKTFPLSRVYISQMRGVSLKTQLRLPQDVKRSFCKRCDTLLIPGVNCAEEMRNDSRGGKKPWADVRVVRCGVCDTEKRFPRGQKKGLKLAERKKREAESKKEEGQFGSEEKPTEVCVS